MCASVQLWHAGTMAVAADMDIEQSWVVRSQWDPDTLGIVWEDSEDRWVEPTGVWSIRVDTWAVLTTEEHVVSPILAMSCQLPTYPSTCFTLPKQHHPLLEAPQPVMILSLETQTKPTRHCINNVWKVVRCSTNWYTVKWCAAIQDNMHETMYGTSEVYEMQQKRCKYAILDWGKIDR
jgi:hypothetical protein